MVDIFGFRRSGTRKKEVRKAFGIQRNPFKNTRGHSSVTFTRLDGPDAYANGIGGQMPVPNTSNTVAERGQEGVRGQDGLRSGPGAPWISQPVNDRHSAWTDTDTELCETLRWKHQPALYAQAREIEQIAQNGLAQRDHWYRQTAANLVEAQERIRRVENERDLERQAKQHAERQVENSNRSLKGLYNELEDIKTKHAVKLREAENARSEATRKMQNTKTTHEREKAQLESSVQRLTRERDESIAYHKQKTSDMYREYKNNLESTSREAKRSIEQLKHQHTGKIDQLVRDHEQAMQKLKQDNIANEKRLDQLAQDERHTLTETYKEKLKTLTEKHIDEVRSLKDEITTTNDTAEKQFADLKARLEKEKDDLVQGYTSQIEQLQTTHRVKVDQMTSDYVQKRAALIARHDKNSRHLRIQVQELNNALLMQDSDVSRANLFSTSDLPHKSDDKLRDQIVSVQQVVEEIARLPWKEQQPHFTEEVLGSIHSHQDGRRFLRKAILQHLIWNSLYEFVFSTPFRVFGEEGTKLEKEWLGQCSEGEDSATPEDADSSATIWPVASTKAERWRYLTIRECHESLTNLTSAWDSRTRLRKGFMSSMGALKMDLKTKLEDVITPDSSAVLQPLLGKLSKRAATVWLDYAMHRCRIVIALTGTSGATTQPDIITSMKRAGELTLTISPMLGRYGNVKGAELDSFTKIDDGVMEVIQTS